MGCLRGDTLPGLGDAQRSRSPSCAAQGGSYSKPRCFLGGPHSQAWRCLGTPCSGTAWGDPAPEHGTWGGSGSTQSPPIPPRSH